MVGESVKVVFDFVFKISNFLILLKIDSLILVGIISVGVLFLGVYYLVNR